MRFVRKPVRHSVLVDGRQVGSSFRTSGMAHSYADELQSEAPWSVVEVVSHY